MRSWNRRRSTAHTESETTTRCLGFHATDFWQTPQRTELRGSTRNASDVYRRDGTNGHGDLQLLRCCLGEQCMICLQQLSSLNGKPEPRMRCTSVEPLTLASIPSTCFWLWIYGLVIVAGLMAPCSCICACTSLSVLPDRAKLPWGQLLLTPKTRSLKSCVKQLRNGDGAQLCLLTGLTFLQLAAGVIDIGTTTRRCTRIAQRWKQNACLQISAGPPTQLSVPVTYNRYIYANHFPRRHISLVIA